MDQLDFPIFVLRTMAQSLILPPPNTQMHIVLSQAIETIFGDSSSSLLGYKLCLDVGMPKIILNCIGTHYNGVYPNLSSIPLNTQGQMLNEFKMARALEKEGSLHIGGAISQVTRKEIMINEIKMQEKELGRPVVVEEIFNVTHVKKSTNPTEEERWI
ncbi:hypothetical protein H5410_004892 [Solanum commersonii]|uniref:Uncharacterized protein n=1 Tax=Solanum commersonii TaxID=4109 RepID=A0A9J6A5M0_SOLCO|nr:hypothetical protein H5410_004892 [Solanum commersonii]